MTLQITIHLFSGRADPEWTIDGANEQELRRLLESPAVDTAVPIPSRLGYRGFSVIDPAAPEQELVHVQAEGQSIPSRGFYGAPEIAEFLLRTGRAQNTPFLDGIVPTLAEPLPRAVRAVVCPPSLAADAPPYEPAAWVDPIQSNTNCYAYGVNYKSATNIRAATPGRKSLNWANYWSGASTYSGAVTDGLLPVLDFSTPQPAGVGHYVALVVSPGRDHHWYRQDDNGCWSHKMGIQAVKNIDDAGQNIADPRTAARGGYSVFVGFFLVPLGTIVA